MIIGRTLLNPNKERGDKMSHSIVRWLIVPDTWNFTDEIVEKNPENPAKKETTSGYSIATWFTTEDEWNRKFEKIFSNVLIKVNDSYYTYQNNEFIKVEPTEENFEEYSVNLMELVTPNSEGIKPLMTLENPEIVHLTDKENPRLYIKGFRDLRPLMESDSPKLLIHPGTEEGQPVINVKYHPEPQLILPTGDIYLKMLDKIHNFTIYSNKNQGGDIKIVFSVDSGNTWQTYNSETQEFEKIDITNMAEVREKGIEPDVFNAIEGKWNEIIESKIRFGYYIEQRSSDDIAEVDELEVEMDLHGRWRKAEHIKDYDYEYDNEHIYVSFLKDGSYKVNYQG